MSVELGSPDFWQLLRTNPGRLAQMICAINLSNLDEQMARHAATRAWINAAYETARIAEEHAKWELTKARAAAMMRVKREKDPETGKAKLAGVMDAEIEQDVHVLEATADLLTKKEIHGSLKAIATALEDRKDMFIQLSANQRKERDSY